MLKEGKGGSFSRADERRGTLGKVEGGNQSMPITVRRQREAY